jgi:hypothetical protein
MEVTHTYETWQAISETIRTRNMNFSQGHHERMAEAFADELDLAVELSTINEDAVTLDFGDDWDAYLVVRTAASAVGTLQGNLQD